MGCKKKGCFRKTAFVVTLQGTEGTAHGSLSRGGPCLVGPALAVLPQVRVAETPSAACLGKPGGPPSASHPWDGMLTVQPGARPWEAPGGVDALGAVSSSPA